MKYWIRYVAAAVAGGTVIGAAYFLPPETFLAFVIGWVFLIPAVSIVYLIYGLREYMKDRKNRIFVSVKPSEAMKALARKEAELKRERELLFEEMQREVKGR